MGLCTTGTQGLHVWSSFPAADQYRLNEWVYLWVQSGPVDEPMWRNLEVGHMRHLSRSSLFSIERSEHLQRRSPL